MPSTCRSALLEPLRPPSGASAVSSRGRAHAAPLPIPRPGPLPAPAFPAFPQFPQFPKARRSCRPPPGADPAFPGGCRARAAMGSKGARGYYKLFGQNASGDAVDVVLREAKVFLGREKAADAEKRAPDFVPLGASSQISRQHATIFRCDQHKAFRILCHSKNGMTVNKKFYGKGSTVTLRNRSAVRLAGARLYFLLPRGPASGGGTAAKAGAPSPGAKRKRVDDGGGGEDAPSAKVKAVSRQEYVSMVRAAFARGGKELQTLPELIRLVAQAHGSDFGDKNGARRLRNGIRRALEEKDAFLLAAPDDDSNKRLYRAVAP